MNPSYTLLPWHQSYWDLFRSYIDLKRIPQAILLTGQAGLGKHQLARVMAQRLLCETPLDNNNFCGQCRGCRLFQANTHPDFYFIQPVDLNESRINIGQIRGLIASLQLKPNFDAYRVVIITRAEQMNISAANGFLKCLEEPADKTMFLLISENNFFIPRTIISRCQKINIAVPDQIASLQWLKEQNIGGGLPVLLKMAQGSPLRAVEISGDQQYSLRKQYLNQIFAVASNTEDPVVVAESWMQNEDTRIYEWFICWVMDLIKIKYDLKPVHLYNPDYLQALQELAQKLELVGLVEFYDKFLERRVQFKSNLNRQLFNEELLIAWSHLNSNGGNYG